MPWFFLSGMRSRMCSRTVEEGSTNRPESADRIVRQARRNASRNAHDGGATHSSRVCGSTGRRPRCPERPTVHGRTAAGAPTRGRPGRCGPVGCARHDPIPPAAAGGASPPERAGRRGVAVHERCRHGLAEPVGSACPRRDGPVRPAGTASSGARCGIGRSCLDIRDGSVRPPLSERVGRPGQGRRGAGVGRSQQRSCTSRSAEHPGDGVRPVSRTRNGGRWFHGLLGTASAW